MQSMPSDIPIVLGSRLELFMDNYLLERRTHTQLKLHTPIDRGPVLYFDNPWEGKLSGYPTIIQVGKTYKMYYRGLNKVGGDGTEAEFTCYAESEDGIHWIKPMLGLFEIAGNRNNNVVLAYDPPFSHNFSPFYDTNPNCPDDQRYKAVSGTYESKVFGFVSPDGIHWTKIKDTPIFSEGIFDSQNVAFWSETEGCYVLFYRTWTAGAFKGLRTISRATSTDFISWTDAHPMSFGDTPMEDLYTNQTQPYFRAPHIYIAVPMRFMPGRKVLTPEQTEKLGVHEQYQADCAEAVVMTSRGGTTYDRTFMEAFIRPGMDLGNWASRAGMTALGFVWTDDAYISMYKQAHYAQDSAHLVRYELRLDGFGSLHADFDGGTAETKIVVFQGSELVVNFSSSAAGGIRIGLCDEFRKPISGLSLDDCDELIGDQIDRVVRWNGISTIQSLEGKPVRLQFSMKDADLYSIQFR
jgi:hypothetical protein